MAERATWEEVLRPFSFAPRETAEQLMQRLTNEWCPILGVEPPALGPATPVRRERWSHRRVGRHIDAMARLQPKMRVTKPPRFDHGALVLVEFAPGVIGQIDGRHRANLWRHRPGQYEVLILEAWNAHPAGE